MELKDYFGKRIPMCVSWLRESNFSTNRYTEGAVIWLVDLIKGEQNNGMGRHAV